MVELTAKQIAETHAEAARINYERDGHLAPVVHVLDSQGAGITMIPNPERFHGMVREQLASLVMMSADAIDTAFVGTCVEAWEKAYPDADPAAGPPDIERGQLSREAETDPDIRTCLVVTVIDVNDAERSHNVMSLVVGDPRDHTYDIRSTAGPMDGAMVDMVITAYNAACLGALPLPAGAYGSVENRLHFLGAIDFLVAASYTEARDGS